MDASYHPLLNQITFPAGILEDLVDFFGRFEPIPGTRINGRLTLGENIADLGGLELAHAAYRRHVARHGEPEVLDGLTGDQRFFLSWAQVWRNRMRESTLRGWLLVDPHSPPEYRVNGVLPHMDASCTAFYVDRNDAMYVAPEARVRIW